MEKDNEVSGEGNSYTTHFRQLDPRIGRWFSTDPVYKEFISPYNSMSNSPIMRVDPRGDDDYFDAFGNYLGSDNKTSNNIIVLRDLVPHSTTKNLYKWKNSNMLIDADVALRYDYTDLMSLNYENPRNKQVLENVGNYYLKKLGIEDKKIDTKKRDNSVAFTIESTYPDDIFISLNGGMISPDLNDAMNFQSVMVHEDDHFNDRSDIDLLHTDMYLTQIKHSTFQGVTDNFRTGVIRKIQNYLNSALENDTSTLEEVKARMAKVNEYSFDLGGELFYNEESNKIELFYSLGEVDLDDNNNEDNNDEDNNSDD